MSYNKFSIKVFGGKTFFSHTTTAIGELHTHDFFEISYVIRGSVRHSSINSETLLSNDRFLIFRPGDVHAFDERDNKTAYHRDILITTDFFKPVCDFISPDLYDKIMNEPSNIVVPFSQDEFKALEALLKYFSTCDLNDDEAVNYVGRSILSYILLLYRKNANLINEPSRQFIDDIMDAMKSPNVVQHGIPALIKEVNYSHGHLCRLVKQHLGKKLLDVLTDIRMEQAAVLLKTSDVPLVDIAAMVGYESLSHFISVFEKHYSLSPYKYRKHFKEVNDLI